MPELLHRVGGIGKEGLLTSGAHMKTEIFGRQREKIVSIFLLACLQSVFMFGSIDKIHRKL